MTISTKIRKRDDAGFDGDVVAQPARAHEEAADEEPEDGDRDGDREDARRSRNRMLPNQLSRERNGKPTPVAKWFSVTSAKAQNPQKTKACARPGRGRSRITLLLQHDFRDEIPDAFADGIRVENRRRAWLRGFLRSDSAEAQRRSRRARRPAEPENRVISSRENDQHLSENVARGINNVSSTR